MVGRKKDKIDDKALSKKYRTNVKKLISAWKKGYSDMEVAQLTGVDTFTLQQIKIDIELAHRRLRNERKKKSQGQITRERHIFLSPFI